MYTEIVDSHDGQYDVLILGAGISGLSAAHRLIGYGNKLKIAIIEAQNRYGGRLQSKSFGTAGYVELGGTWIHGADERNAVYRLAQSYGLIDCDAELFDRKLGLFHGLNGSIDQSLAGEVYEALKEIEYDAMHLPETDKRSMDQYFDDRVQDLKALPEYANCSEFIDSAVWYAKQYMQLHGGDSLKSMCAWGFGYWSRFEIDGDTTIRGGYSTLLARMLADIGPDKLRLNEEVLTVDWSSKECVRVVTTKAQLTAKHVLITFPLGVLKATHSQLFTPALPECKVAAIESMGYGKLEKIFLLYDKPFWSPGGLNCLKFYSTEKDRSPVAGSGNEFVEIINGFEELTSTSNVLLGWVTGDNVERLRQYSPRQIIKKCSQLIRLYTGNDSIPDADNVLITGWCANRFIRGSYTYPSMTTQSPDEFRALSEPIEKRIFFSGEAMHVRYYSAVHGAIESAIDAADAIYRASNVHFRKSKL